MSKKQPNESPEKLLKRSWKKLKRKLKGNDPVVAVLRLEGIIGDLGFKKGLTLNCMEDDIEKAFDVCDVKAVAVQINSPGGSPVQSELLFTRIRKLSEEKKIPVFTFAEDAAASGGYWLACAGDEIYASASSVVGSIGVISSGFGFVEAIKKLGVERRVYTQGENKSILDSFKAEDPNSVRILMGVMKDLHDSFKDMVRERRKDKIKKDKENELFSGEFWSGKSALELGLIDGIGDLQTIIKEKYGKKVKFERISKPKGWLKKKLGGLGASFTEGIIGSANERDMWARLGL